jgi:hypothetical protein
MSDKQSHAGMFRPGNRDAETHGVYTFENRGPAALPPDLRLSVDEFRAQIVSDRGGVDALTAIEGGYIRRLGELETVARLLASDLASRGLFTPRGRVRNTFSRWLETLDRWDRYAQRIGVDSRRPVLTLHQRLASITPTHEAGGSATDDERGQRNDGGIS